jgi:hypothetical protein
MSRRTVRSSEVEITYAPRPDATPEAELNALATVFAYVCECWHARRGDPHDLTNDVTPKTVQIGPRKTEQEKT